ncbi:hypothetical protein [Rhizobium leguminosarum]|uniref:hypothetical protein n=1 Tax=Rhizobium leguminosarum TaxID=384 RepID=UPI0003693479|nr:hypothetical protein [Rhizobium leguminosarum]
MVWLTKEEKDDWSFWGKRSLMFYAKRLGWKLENCPDVAFVRIEFMSLSARRTEHSIRISSMHVLLTTALVSTVRDEIPLPEGAKYDVALGAWRGDSGLLAFDPDTDRVSKKQDVETGEDQKGQ